MKPLYIFDLDGTIADIEHRRPILDNKDNPHRWVDFFSACIGDKPNYPVIKTMESLVSSGNEIFIFSGRSEVVREETFDWLLDHLVFSFVCFSQLKMRPENDYTPDDQLKEQWLNEMSREDRDRLVAVFDDRDKVVDMWRRNGVACFQVANGDF